MKEKTIKGFDESKEYTEIGIKHVMGVLFWDYNEEELNRIVPDNGLRKRKRYPGSALLPMAIKWNAIKKSDIQLNGELLGQGEVKVSTKEFVEYILKKIELSQKEKLTFRYVDLYSLLCNLSVATRYDIKVNRVEFYEYEEEYTE